MRPKDVVIAIFAGCIGYLVTAAAIVVRRVLMNAASNSATGIGAVALAVADPRSIAAFVLCTALAVWFRRQRRTRF